MSTKIEKAYEAKKYEDRIYKIWEKSGLFTPKIIKGKKPFTIVMPPPNATGTLHLGHATMLAIEDIMIRFKRMNGVPTLWLPGTDHAGIATQNKVEKMLAVEGLTRQSMGREKFLERVHSFVKESRSEIRTQIRKMGSSCDWTRERYTLDKGLSAAVSEVFTRMYKDGLIYRGPRIVNWCTRCNSTLADDEVVFKEEKTKFYYLRYGPVIIGTARPETKFLDKIIAVHPDDKRYKKYLDKKLKVNWIDSEIEAMFIADKNVDPEFGSGAMTLTPAHDFLDFDIAKKYDLEIVQIIGPDGNFTKAVGVGFAGKNAKESRDAIIKILEGKGLLESVDENYVHNLSVCYRCDTPIEPLISEQWFIDVNKPVIKDKKIGGSVGNRHAYSSLKQKASEVVHSGQIEIIPKRFHKIYFHWLDNLRDWCISRQIWFGHQVPVWYCVGDEKCLLDCKQPIVQVETPLKCPHCGSKKLRRDPDTLDTWFSSGLWTFSTLGWPQKTKDLAYFHPTSVLETGHDILFFWIARMILMTVYAMNDIPFEKVYLHGLVRDRNGIKMSKSANNGINPLDMIEKYGTDSVRLSLVIGTAAGTDFRLYEEKIAGYRNFVNKIWNGARFALLNASPDILNQPFSAKYIKTSFDKLVISKLQKLIKETTEDLEKDRFSEAGTKIYTFYWSFFCDWYIELSKSSADPLQNKDIKQNLHVLIFVLKTLLKLLHPFVPFVTEALWSHLGQKTLLIGEKWPKYNKKFVFSREEKDLQIIMNLISAARSIRVEKNIEPSRKMHAVFYGGKYSKLIESKKESIMRMAKLEKLEIKKTGPKIPGALWKYIDGIHMYFPLKDLFDLDKERHRLRQKLDETGKKMQVLESRLDNPHFLSKAPAEIVLKEKELFKALEKELQTLEEKISELE